MVNKMEKKLEGNILTLKRVLAIRDVVERFVAEYNHDRDAIQVAVRLETLDRINQELQRATGGIERLDSEKFEEHI